MQMLWNRIPALSLQIDLIKRQQNQFVRSFSQHYYIWDQNSVTVMAGQFMQQF